MYSGAILLQGAPEICRRPVSEGVCVTISEGVTIGEGVYDNQ